MKIIITNLDRHQDEVLKSLQTAYEAQWQVCQKELDHLDTIAQAMAKFQASILMEKGKWKIQDNN